jgi:hypothetical protein
MGMYDKWKASRDRIHESEDSRSSANNAATRSDIRRLNENLTRQNRQASTSATAKTAIKSIGKGVVDIARSLNTPNTNQRPRIAQLPETRSSIGISQNINLENMKAKGLRGQNIKGR